MDYIKTADISDPNIQMPWTGPIIDFLQNRNNQSNNAFAWAHIGNILLNHSNMTGGVPVVGCEKTTSGNTMFNGWILWQGELYFFPGAMGLLAYANVPVFVLDETNDFTVGSVEFSDAVFRYVTKVRRLKVVDQVSGTGLFDMSAMGRIIAPTEILATDTATSSGAGVMVTGGSFTTPNRVCDLEIEVTCDALITSANVVAPQGGEVQIYNSTTSTAYQLKRISVSQEAVAIDYRNSVHVKKIIRNVPANSTIGARIIRLDANNIYAYHVVVNYREILRSKMW